MTHRASEQIGEKAGRSAPPSSNRRRDRRHTAKGGTKLHCTRNALGLGPNVGVTVLDLSESGVRMVLKAEVAPGQELEVCLMGVSGVSQKRVADVIWVVPTADGLFCVGARFQKALPFASLYDLSRR